MNPSSMLSPEVETQGGDSSPKAQGSNERDISLSPKIPSDSHVKRGRDREKYNAYMKLYMRQWRKEQRDARK